MWCGWVQGNSDGPLVPMVRLVPMEKHHCPMVLLVTMHLINGMVLLVTMHFSKETWMIFSCGVAWYRAIPIGTNGKAPYSNGAIGDYASH